LKRLNIASEIRRNSRAGEEFIIDKRRVKRKKDVYELRVYSARKFLHKVGFSVGRKMKKQR